MPPVGGEPAQVIPAQSLIPAVGLPTTALLDRVCLLPPRHTHAPGDLRKGPVSGLRAVKGGLVQYDARRLPCQPL